MKNYENNLLEHFKQQQTKFTEEELQQLIQRLPEDYYRLSDFDDILESLKALDSILNKKQIKKTYESDIETFAVMAYDYNLLKNTMKEFYRNNTGKAKLFRLYRDKDKKFFILGSYRKLEDSPRAKEADLQIPPWKEFDIIKNNPNLKKRMEISAETENDYTWLEIQILNTSMLTLSRNLLESLETYEYSFIEIWSEEKLDRKIKSVFKVSIHFFEKLGEPKLDSLQKDLNRYIQNLIAYRSLFDIVGPSMVGPSSSHTAGANRIGHISRNIIEALLKNKKIEPIHQIKVRLIGSFRDTGLGHHTPEAIIGGLCGYPTDDENMIKKGIEAVKNKDHFNFTIAGRKIGFGGFTKGDSNDDSFYKDQHNSNIVEIIALPGKNKDELTITGFSIGGGNVEIRFINRRRLNGGVIDGKKETILNYETRTICDGPGNDISILAIDKNASPPKEEYSPAFNTFEEMLEIFGENTKDDKLVEKMISVEKGISGMSKTTIFDTLKGHWRIMKQSIDKGLHDSQLSTFKLTGGDSGKILASLEDSLPGLKNNIYGLALAYAVSVNEVNARSGVIIACPTGGACGLLPAVLRAWEQTCTRYTAGEKEKRILEAMMVAGFFGMILFDDVPTAGADLGCQAEIGGGTAMSAAALAYLEGGTLNQVVEAFTLALKNCMGLVCDPVAGLVEVPCVKRNGIYATAAISAAVMALAGVKSMISPDEVVLAVKEVGEKMSDEYKETARGGLAQTRDGKKINRLFEQATAEFFL